MIFPVFPGSRVRSRLRVVFFPAQNGHTYCPKLGSCSRLWSSGYRRWFINQGSRVRTPGGDLFFQNAFRGVSPVTFWTLTFLGSKSALLGFGPFWGRSRRIPGLLSSSAMQLSPGRTKYSKLRKRNHAKRAQGRRDLDLTAWRFSNHSVACLPCIFLWYISFRGVSPLILVGAEVGENWVV